jgi:hypothetical protein
VLDAVTHVMLKISLITFGDDFDFDNSNGRQKNLSEILGQIQNVRGFLEIVVAVFQHVDFLSLIRGRDYGKVFVGWDLLPNRLLKLNKRHSDQVMFEILDNGHESHTQERTENDDDSDLRCHESSNGHSAAA